MISQRYFEGVNASEGRLKKNIVGYVVEKTELLGRLLIKLWFLMYKFRGVCFNKGVKGIFCAEHMPLSNENEHTCKKNGP